MPCPLSETLMSSMSSSAGCHSKVSSSLSPYARAQLMREALLQSIEHVLRRTSLRCFNRDMEYVWMYCIQIRSNQDPVSHAFPPLRAQVSPVLAYYSAR